jgi:hypothetical protein
MSSTLFITESLCMNALQVAKKVAGRRAAVRGTETDRENARMTVRRNEGRMGSTEAETIRQPRDCFK